MKTLPLWLALAALGCTGGDSPFKAQGGGVGGEGGSTTTTTAGGAGGQLTCTDATACDNACVDLNTDPNNCGACGVTCVVPGAAASCNAGACAIGTCNEGFADCDADVNNGCEIETDCTEGGACTTSCNTVGLLDCTSPCAPSCSLPPEACNLEDDDCNDSCDDGAIAGCRVGVHRAIGGSGHYYGTNQTDIENLGNTIEALNYFYLYAQPTGALRPFFRCPKGGGQTFLTTATDCEIGAGPEATVGYISATADNCNSVPLYRTSQGTSGAHFYTTSAAERDNAVNNLGYVDEGIAGYIWSGP